MFFLGGGLNTSHFFNRTLYPYQEIATSTLSFSKPHRLFKGFFLILKGFIQSRRMLKAYSPDLVIGFGSYYTLPVLLAALSLKIPYILHEQNAIPGKVNRLFSKWADQVAITFPSTPHILKRKTIEVLFPRRTKEETEEEAWRYFGLKPGLLTLLIFGGSNGANRINHIFLEGLPDMPFPFQVIHFTGKDPEEAKKAEKKYRAFKIPSYVRSFEPEMGKALKIADLAICRAGAATVSELQQANLPALLIPYPFAIENHQQKNAEHFVKAVKGGEMVLEENLNSQVLIERIREIKNSLEAKKQNIKHYAAERKLKSFSEVVLAEVL